MKNFMKSRKIQLVNENVLKKLKLVRNTLERHPDFNLVRKSRICNFLKKNANEHSVAIEFPVRNKRENGKVALENLTLAQDYLNNYFKGELTGENLRNAVALINGFDESMLYRTIEARTQDKQGYFIYPKDVPNKIYQFLEENKTLGSSVEKAIHSHFNIAVIHPFEDGNGRLARLIQNSFLISDKYPPIIIPANERDKYLDFLSEASRERKEFKALKPKQVKFYEYLCSKLEDSLKEVGKLIQNKNKI